MKKLLLAVLLVSVSACDIVVTGPTVTNTNTNTNTNNVDVHDIGTSFQNPNIPPNTTPGGETPVNIPSGAQQIAEKAVNQAALARSCQDTYGESAWLFLDTIVLALKTNDARWGYLVKTNGSISRDVIAYRGTTSNIGAWGVDVIIDQCGTPKFGWNVIGYDPAAHWVASR